MTAQDDAAHAAQTEGTTWPARVVAFFDPDSTWERPLPEGATRRDLLWCLAYLGLASMGLELTRSMSAMDSLTIPTLAQHAVVWAGVAPLAIRRRAPVVTGALTSIIFMLTVFLFPVLSWQWAAQVTTFAAIYAMFAWAHERRLAILVGISMLLFVFLWIGWSAAVGSAVDEYIASRGDDEPTGPIGPVQAMLIYTVLSNLVYFVGAAVCGQLSWRNARQRVQLAEQNEQLQAQAQAAREQAQVQERLRIARELHDVVAHHISVIGVQAAGARRVLHRDAELTAQALGVVEESSRRAVTEMRSLLGTLRAGGDVADNAQNPDRSPDPSARDIATLVHTAPDLATTYQEITEPGLTLDDVPPGVGLAMYRTVQEAIANVRRHSTAQEADVVLRLGTARDASRFAEVEILDSGRPRGNTSGSGLGLLGMRERLAGLGGTSEIGPRTTGGYRVRVRFPLSDRPAPVGSGTFSADA